MLHKHHPTAVQLRLTTAQPGRSYCAKILCLVTAGHWSLVTWLCLVTAGHWSLVTWLCLVTAAWVLESGDVTVLSDSRHWSLVTWLCLLVAGLKCSLPDPAAQVGLRALAELALPTLGNVERDHMIPCRWKREHCGMAHIVILWSRDPALMTLMRSHDHSGITHKPSLTWCNRRDSHPHTLDHTPSLMSQDAREQPLGVQSLQGIGVCVAHPRGQDLGEGPGTSSTTAHSVAHPRGQDLGEGPGSSSTNYSTHEVCGDLFRHSQSHNYQATEGSALPLPGSVKLLRAVHCHCLGRSSY